MVCEAFREFNFQRRTREMIERANQVLDDPDAWRSALAHEARNRKKLQTLAKKV
jgi:hypothetical protein